MLTYKKILLVFVVILGYTGFNEKINGQSFHFNPPSTYEPEPGTILLRISISETSLKGMIFNIIDDQIFITLPEGGRRNIQLGDKSIRSIIAEIEENIPEDLKIITNFPTLRAQLLRAQIIKFDKLDSLYAFTSRKNVPSVSIDFGTLFSLGQRDSDEENNLLESSGFLLNIVGTHKLFKIDKINTIAHLQARMTLISDAQLQVSETNNENPDGQLEQALIQADIFELATQGTFTYIGENNFEIDVNGFAGLSWSSVENFEFPETIRLRDSTYTSDELFDPQQIMNVNAFFNSRGPQPLYELGISMLSRFKRNNSIAFYTGFGLIRKQQLRRGFSFQTDGSGIPDPETLRPRINTPYLDHLKFIAGMRIGGIFDIRADATRPINTDTALPQLRLVISKDFPVIN